MNKLKVWLMAGAVVFGLMSALALAQTSVRVRGVITAFDGHVLAIKTRDGNDLKVSITTILRSAASLRFR